MLLKLELFGKCPKKKRSILKHTFQGYIQAVWLTKSKLNKVRQALTLMGLTWITLGPGFF